MSPPNLLSAQDQHLANFPNMVLYSLALAKRAQQLQCGVVSRI